MEIMAIPNKETLIFYNQVRPWIVSGEMNNGIMNYRFSEDTPKEILDLFSEIKSHFSYPCIMIY
ncbi:hypothetical protein [Streptococcus sp. sy010]|uniref:hypothetical protein n=1 Tax=Streptococcus sp. sy010 TaxID=2600148 RepID=UPI0011B7233B|nr:hypothetical protein [Streptococcus sp. sy010]TWT14772.1 hypothetical protein FRX51_04160 [Streptococcus sp. sy010]